MSFSFFGERTWGNQSQGVGASRRELKEDKEYTIKHQCPVVSDGEKASPPQKLSVQ